MGGSWLFLREFEQASPVVLSALASMLLNLNLAHTYTSGNPVIQVSTAGIDHRNYHEDL